uniref:Transcription elongation factor S-II n=1 Tax=Pristionchus pacificus TaxID=54126 RepID=A0A8R1YGH9_PRIPA
MIVDALTWPSRSKMSSCEDDVVAIRKKLEKMIEGSKPQDDAAELVEALARLPINYTVLNNTRVGLVMNDLRKKTSNEKLSKRIKQLIKDWKTIVETHNSGNGNGGGSGEKAEKTAPVARTESSSSSTMKEAGDSQPTPTPRPKLAPTVAQFSGAFPPKSIEGDDIRVKSAQMLLSALKMGEMPDGTLDPEQLAVHRGTSDKYKAALRSRVFNLRDKKNVALRENVLTGVVSTDKFAVMLPEEMASDEIKKMRETHAVGHCGKCGKKNCTYTQLQTRSADEPMTTFVFCMECGNRWKFC